MGCHDKEVIYVPKRQNILLFDQLKAVSNPGGFSHKDFYILCFQMVLIQISRIPISRFLDIYLKRLNVFSVKKPFSTNKILKVIGCYSCLLSQRISVLSYALNCAIHEFLFEQWASTDKNNFVSSYIVIIIGKSYICKVIIGFFMLIHMVGR